METTYIVHSTWATLVCFGNETIVRERYAVFPQATSYIPDDMYGILVMRPSSWRWVVAASSYSTYGALPQPNQWALPAWWQVLCCG